MNKGEKMTIFLLLFCFLQKKPTLLGEFTCKETYKHVLHVVTYMYTYIPTNKITLVIFFYFISFLANTTEK